MFIEHAEETRRWLQVSSAQVDFARAEQILEAFGEPLRRRVMEVAAGAARRTTELASRIPGWKVADVRHRMRSLAALGLVSTHNFDAVRLKPETVKVCSLYTDILITLSSRTCLSGIFTMDIDAVLFALSDKKRRNIFELIIIRPDGIAGLAERSAEIRQNVSYHVNGLMIAGLIERSGERFYPVNGPMPQLRMYFERLWLEAELGDAWLARRKIEAADYGI